MSAQKMAARQVQLRYAPPALIALSRSRADEIGASTAEPARYAHNRDDLGDVFPFPIADADGIGKMQPFSMRRGALFLALAALAACDAPPTATRTAPAQPEDVRAMVEAMGFRGDMVQDFGDYVVVEGDIRIGKAELPT